MKLVAHNMFKTIILASLFLSLNTKAASIIADGVIQGGNAIVQSKNFVKNPFCQKNTTNITMSEVTAARDIDAADKLNGTSSCALSSSANNVAHTAYFAVNTLDNDVLYGNCEMSLYYKGLGATDAWTFSVDDGAGAVLTSVALTDATNWTKAVLNYPCGASIRPGLSTTAESKTLNVGNVYWGPATNIGSVAQAELYGQISWVSTTGCSWTKSPSGLTAFDADAQCDDNTITYLKNAIPDASTPGQLPQIRFANLPAGDYYIVASGFFSKDNTGTNAANFSFHDGSTYGGDNPCRNYTTYGACGSVIGRFSYSTAGARTFAIRGDGGGAQIGIGVDGYGLVISVYRFPNSAEIAVRSDTAAQSWQGYFNQPSGGCSLTSGSTADFSSCTSIALTQIQNTNLGTVSAAGSGLPGITFTPSRVGIYGVCARVGLNPSAAARQGIYLTDGSNNVLDVYQAFPRNASDSWSAYVCTDYNATSTAAVTIKVRGSTSAGTLAISDDLGSGRSMTWTILAKHQAFPTPNFPGNITSNSSGQERRERAIIVNNGSTCVASSQSGSWITTPGTRNGTGDCSFTIAGGIFSATPTCVCTVQASTSYAIRGCSVSDSISTTLLRTHMWGGSAAIDGTISVVCDGPR